MTERIRNRKRYPSDVTDEEWWFAATYLTLMREDAPQGEHSLRDVFDALRWLVKTGGQWRYLPGDFPPWPAVSQQARRWLAAGVFEADPQKPQNIHVTLLTYQQCTQEFGRDALLEDLERTLRIRRKMEGFDAADLESRMLRHADFRARPRE